MKKIFFIVFLFINLSFAYSKIIINEIMSNARDEYKEEFIELYNNSSEYVSIEGWSFSDGASIDSIVPWDITTNDTISNQTLSFGTYILPPNSYAVILDSQYTQGSKPYNFKDNTVIFTTTDTTLGSGGIKNTDETITLYNSSGNVVSTYGTPLNNNDGVPYDAGDGISIERRDFNVEDIESNWASCISADGATPGEQNSIYGSQFESAKLVVITEIMPNHSKNDWIEFFVLNDSESLAGYKLYEGNTLVKTFPNITGSVNDYIILHFNSTLPDEVTSKGYNETWDLYTQDMGLVGTDNIIILTDKFGRVVDFVSYANNDGTFSNTNTNLLRIAKQNNDWSAQNISELDCIDWRSSSAESISRKKGNNNLPIDTNMVLDWHVYSPSPGSGYYTSISQEGVVLKVQNVPFSPWGDSKFSEAKIHYSVPQNSIINLRIFNIQGRKVKTLVSSSYEMANVVFWDGTDDNETVLPVGVYIILFDITNVETGKKQKLKELIVLAKKI